VARDVGNGSLKAGETVLDRFVAKGQGKISKQPPQIAAA